MRTPNFTDRAYDTVMDDDGYIWYIVFPDEEARERYVSLIKMAPIVSIGALDNAYATNAATINSLGFMGQHEILEEETEEEEQIEW